MQVNYLISGGRNILNWALINYEKEFGITVHYVDSGIDTGDILEQVAFPITDQDDYQTLLRRAYIGCAQLERLEEFVATKKRIQKVHNENLLNIKGVSALPEPKYEQSASWFSGIIIDTNQLGQLKEIREKLRKLNIDARPFWKPIHKQLPYAYVPKESLSNTDKIWDKLLILPCSTNLTEDNQNTVIKAVQEVLC